MGRSVAVTVVALALVGCGDGGQPVAVSPVSTDVPDAAEWADCGDGDSGTSISLDNDDVRIAAASRCATTTTTSTSTAEATSTTLDLVPTADGQQPGACPADGAEGWHDVTSVNGYRDRGATGRVVTASAEPPGFPRQFELCVETDRGVWRTTFESRIDPVLGSSRPLGSVDLGGNSDTIFVVVGNSASSLSLAAFALIDGHDLRRLETSADESADEFYVGGTVAHGAGLSCSDTALIAYTAVHEAASRIDELRYIIEEQRYQRRGHVLESVAHDTFELTGPVDGIGAEFSTYWALTCPGLEHIPQGDEPPPWAIELTDAVVTLDVGETGVLRDVNTHCGTIYLDREINSRRWMAPELAALETDDAMPPAWGRPNTNIDLVLTMLDEQTMTVTVPGSGVVLTYVAISDQEFVPCH